MKLKHTFFLLLLSLFFAGCASKGPEGTTKEAPADETPAATGEAGPKSTQDTGSLMDQYKSGEIPGYRK